jgi:methionine-rich copper-binding protein CopC
MRHATPRLRARLIPAALLVLAAGAALAHAVAVQSTPPDAAVLAASPPEVRLRFNATLEPAMTRVSLVDVNGHRTPLEVAPDTAPGEVTAILPVLGPGVYRVVYRVLARDGHVTEGALRFTIQSQ